MTKEELIADLTAQRNKCLDQRYTAANPGDMNWFEGKKCGLDYAIGMLGLLD